MITLNDGDVLHIKDGAHFKHMCCDCGLIHNIAVEINNGTASLYITRNYEMTDEVREEKYNIEKGNCSSTNHLAN